MKQSSLFTLNWMDLLKGSVLAFITAFVTGTIQLLETGYLPGVAQLKSMGIVAVISGISYLLKNFLSNSEGQPVKKENKHRLVHRSKKPLNAVPVILLILLMSSCKSVSKSASKTTYEVDSSSFIKTDVQISIKTDSSATVTKTDKGTVDKEQSFESTKVKVVTYDSAGRKTSETTTTSTRGAKKSREQKAKTEAAKTDLSKNSNFDSKGSAETKKKAETKAIVKAKESQKVIIPWFWIIALVIGGVVFWRIRKFRKDARRLATINV